MLYFWHYVGNKVLTTLSNICTNLNLSDVWTCDKVFRRERPPRALGACMRCSYWGRTYTEGKKITWKDGLTGLWSSLRYNLFG